MAILLGTTYADPWTSNRMNSQVLSTSIIWDALKHI